MLVVYALGGTQVLQLWSVTAVRGPCCCARCPQLPPYSTNSFLLLWLWREHTPPTCTAKLLTILCQDRVLWVEYAVAASLDRIVNSSPGFPVAVRDPLLQAELCCGSQDLLLRLISHADCWLLPCWIQLSGWWLHQDTTGQLVVVGVKKNASTCSLLADVCEHQLSKSDMLDWLPLCHKLEFLNATA